jgi:hypothetical protein
VPVCAKKIQGETLEEKQLETIISIIDSLERSSDELILFAEITLFPTLVLFAIGAALFWAIRGFRPHRRSS